MASTMIRSRAVTLFVSLTVVCACLELASSARVAWAAADHPNVLLIMTDDQGWGDIQSHGNPWLATPTLDRLAEEGARLDRFFVSPVCAPTRASLLTGRYHLRTGTHGVTRAKETMRAEETTLAEMFLGAGYATGCFGKWHNGAHFPHHPLGQGFQRFVGFCDGHWNNYFDTTLEIQGRPRRTQGYIIDVLTDAAIAFMRDHGDGPFFCYVPYNTPHTPWQVPDAWFNKYATRGLPSTTACAYAMCENIDFHVGRMLAELDDLGLMENTIVIFLTDNGPNGDRFNGGMRGRKGSVHEGGIRVPCFVRWPGRIPQEKVVTQVAAHIDLLPTLAELCGIPLQDGLALDGQSLAPLLLDQQDSLPERMIFTHHARGGRVEKSPGSVRTQRWRAVRERESWQLFDMQADPGQERDVASDYPGMLEKLSSAYEDWFQDVTREGFTAIPTEVGHPGWPVVVLPAHEAVLDGELRYHGRAGWANDWIVDWGQADGSARWEINTVTPGRYRATLRYAAAPEAEGVEIQAQIAGTPRNASVREPFRATRVTSPDHVPRKEVYEQLWGRLDLGIWDLPVGTTQVEINVPQAPSEADLEVKAVILERQGAL